MSELNNREQSLVALGAAIASNCVPCVEYHIPGARKAGLSDSEISQAIKIADKVRRVPARAVLEAARHYREAAALRPADATATYDLGVALQDLGRFEEAAEVYGAAIELAPGHADTYFNLSAVYERLGREALIA